LYLETVHHPLGVTNGGFRGGRGGSGGRAVVQCSARVVLDRRLRQGSVLWMRLRPVTQRA
jgi:hypothetical protein